MKNNRLIITLIALFLLGFGLKAQTASTEETAAQKEKRMECFLEREIWEYRLAVGLFVDISTTSASLLCLLSLWSYLTIGAGRNCE